jgi:acylphosphatase
LLVYGRVQGVFFRDATCQAAKRHGLAGWVANRDDGTVEIWLEGPPDAVDAVARWCHDGPPGAFVSKVEIENVSPEGAADFAPR